MKTKNGPVTEFAILERVLSSCEEELSPAAARSFLKLKFDAPTTRTIRQLLRKNNQGTISAEERIDLETYLHVGQLLDLLHARARLTLKRAKVGVER